MGRGRPRSFETGAAMDAVMRVFWAKGFAAASIEDIAEATGLQRPSLYAAFGNKASMFAAALDRFLDLHVAGEVAALSDPEAASADALALSLARTEARLMRNDDPHGCMVAQAIVDAPGLEPDIRAVIGEIVERMESGFAARTHDRAAARLAVAAIVGLGAIARTERRPDFFADAFSALRTAIAPRANVRGRRLL